MKDLERHSLVNRTVWLLHSFSTHRTFKETAGDMLYMGWSPGGVEGTSWADEGQLQHQGVLIITIKQRVRFRANNMWVAPVLTCSAFLSLWNDTNEVALEGILKPEHREGCFHVGHTDSLRGPACTRRVTAAGGPSTSPMCPRPQGIVGLGTSPGQAIHLRPRTITLLDTTGVTGGTTLSEPAFPHWIYIACHSTVSKSFKNTQ